MKFAKKQLRNPRQSNKRITLKQQSMGVNSTATGLTGLQHQLGNRALQRALIQRDKTGGSFNPLDPATIREAASAVIAENEAPVNRWLDEKMAHLRLMSLGQIVAMIRREVSEASRLADVEIQSLVQAWASQHGFTVLIDPGPVAASGGPQLEIPEAVRNAFSIATDGVNLIEQPNGRLNIAVSGVTAQLGDGRLNLGWNGSLGFEIPVDGFVFGAQLSRERWELKLATPGAASLPDPAKLTETFQTAEASLRAIAAAMANLPNLENPAAIQAAIAPYIGPIKDAVQALQSIATGASGPRVSAAITASGSMPGQEAGEGAANDSPEGAGIMATVTFRF